MNLDLARHCIKFIFNSNLIQVVAYGTSFKNFSDGSNDCLPINFDIEIIKESHYK